jgi:hypothetical protein
MLQNFIWLAGGFQIVSTKQKNKNKNKNKKIKAKNKIK